MPDTSSLLSTSDIIQLGGIIFSTLIGVIAIIISVITLRQNHQLVQESTRPYILIYTGITYFRDPNYYLIIKNFGQTGAQITDFSCDYDLSICSYSPTHPPFSHIVGAFVAPGQSLVYIVDPQRLLKDTRLLKMSISYRADKQIFNDTFSLNLDADADMMRSRVSNGTDDLKLIAFALQDISEKML